MNLALESLLRRQQQAFAAAVLAQGTRTDTGTGTEALLRRGPAGSAAAIGVYRHAYSARLVGALRDNFEILARALGDAGFDALATAYIAAQPSRQPSIRWFGDQLIAFMDQRLAADDGLLPHPALADLARMDWALRGAFDAADAPVITRDALAALPPDDWPGLRLLLHPSVRQVGLQWAVEGAWHALRAAADGTAGAANDGDVSDGDVSDSDASDGGADDSDPALPAPAEHAHALLVWRQGLETRWRSLAAPEAAWLQAVADGASFAALCALAAGAVAADDADDAGDAGDAGDDAVPLVVGALQQWLADGLVSGFTA